MSEKSGSAAIESSGEPQGSPVSNKWRATNKSLVFGVFTAAVALGGVALSVVAALLRHPRPADWILAVAVLTLGVLRGLWPGRPWYASRNKVLDVVIYIAVALALLLLSPWTSTMQVT